MTDMEWFVAMFEAYILQSDTEEGEAKLREFLIQQVERMPKDIVIDLSQRIIALRRDAFVERGV